MINSYGNTPYVYTLLLLYYYDDSAIMSQLFTATSHGYSISLNVSIVFVRQIEPIKFECSRKKHNIRSHFHINKILPFIHII